MAQASLRYLDCVIEKLEHMRANAQPIEQASQMIYKALRDGGYLYLYGTGHSHMFVEEMFYRAGAMSLRSKWRCLQNKKAQR